MTSANKGRAWREQRLADALTQLAALHRQLEELQTDGSPTEAAAKRIQAVFRGLHQRRLDQKRTQLSHSRSRSLTGVGMGSTARATEQLFRARCRELFLQYDTDNSGQLSAGELADAVSDWLPDYTAEDMRRLFRSGDKDGSGFLSQREVRCGCARARLPVAQDSNASCSPPPPPLPAPLPPRPAPHGSLSSSSARSSARASRFSRRCARRRRTRK